MMEWHATTAKRALEQAKQKATEALNKLRESELKLVETTSILFVRDKEFANYKRGKKT